MWTTEDRSRCVRRTERYPPDLSDAEWERLAALIPPARTGWSAAHDEHARSTQCSAVSAADGLSVGDAAEGVPPAQHGLQHFPAVAAGWRLGWHPSCAAPAAARADGTRGEPERRHHRQPIGQIG